MKYAKNYKLTDGYELRLEIVSLGKEKFEQDKVRFKLYTPEKKVLFSEVITTGFGMEPLGYKVASSAVGWITLRPGDTDPEHFSKYTSEQLSWCMEHGEWLSDEWGKLFDTVL